jgi:hypothetical protein
MNMARYFFNSHHDFMTVDAVGCDLLNPAAAWRHAMTEARAAAAYEVNCLGTLSLSHRIEVMDHLGAIVTTVHLAEAVHVRP